MRARAGEGPTFIEARVYRFRAHGGSGDDSRTGYRDEQERQSWEKYCPVQMFGTFLEAERVLDRATIDLMEHDITQEIADAFEFALTSPDPTERDLYERVYAE